MIPTVRLPFRPDLNFGFLLRVSDQAPAGHPHCPTLRLHFAFEDEAGLSHGSGSVRVNAKGQARIFLDDHRFCGLVMKKLGPHPTLLDVPAARFLDLPLGRSLVVREGLADAPLFRQVPEAYLEQATAIEVPWPSRRWINDPDPKPCRILAGVDQGRLHVAAIGPRGTAGVMTSRHADSDQLVLGFCARDIVTAIGSRPVGVFAVTPVAFRGDRLTPDQMASFVPREIDAPHGRPDSMRIRLYGGSIYSLRYSWIGDDGSVGPMIQDLNRSRTTRGFFNYDLIALGPGDFIISCRAAVQDEVRLNPDSQPIPREYFPVREVESVPAVELVEPTPEVVLALPVPREESADTASRVIAEPTSRNAPWPAEPSDFEKPPVRRQRRWHDVVRLGRASEVDLHKQYAGFTVGDAPGWEQGGGTSSAQGDPRPDVVAASLVDSTSRSSVAPRSSPLPAPTWRPTPPRSSAHAAESGRCTGTTPAAILDAAALSRPPPRVA